MPPKRRMSAKSKAGGGAPPGANGMAGATATPLAHEECNNAVAFKLVVDAKRMILEHPLFAGIQDMAPLPIQGGDDMTCGQTAPFDPMAFESAMQATGTYTAGFNFFGLDLTYSSNPGIPLRNKGIEMLTEHYFAGPIWFPLILHGVLKSGEDPLVQARSGLIKCITPEELRIAFVLAIARDIDEDAGEDVLKRWRRSVLSVSVKFEVLDNIEAVHWKALQVRENIGQDFATMRRSSLQRIFELVSFKARMEAQTGVSMGAAAIAEAYKSNVKLAETSEELTDAFIDGAIRVHKLMFTIPAVRSVLLHADNLHGVKSPWDSVHKLDKIARRAKGPEALTWVVRGLDFFWETGALRDGFGIRAIEGKGPGQYGKGLVDLMLYKRTLRDSLVGGMLESQQWSAGIKAAMRSVCENHEVFREKCGQHAVQTWRAGWPGSAEAYMKFLRDPCLVAQSPCECMQCSSGYLSMFLFLGPSAWWSFVEGVVVMVSVRLLIITSSRGVCLWCGVGLRAAEGTHRPQDHRRGHGNEPNEGRLGWDLRNVHRGEKKG